MNNKSRGIFMQAVILAAGMGKRLKELTKENTKCMVEVNGVSLIERLLRILDKKELSKIVIVIGYCGKRLEEHIVKLNIHTPIIYIDNKIFDKTNNIYSLSLAKDYLETEDTLLFESDLIFEESIIDRLVADERENLAVVAKYESWMDGTCLELDSNDNITNFIPGKILNFLDKTRYYKTVNIYKFSKRFAREVYVPFLEAYRKAKGENEYYESVIKLIAMLGTDDLKAMRLSSEVWYEIDDIQDLDIAESLFAENAEIKYKMIMSRYGGFWRYPRLLDFCYLVNPYFPNSRMIQEIESNIDTLIRTYPSGARINNLLASRDFSVKQNRMVVGNGAAELIKTLLDVKKFEKLGIIRPTFEEYPNRINDDNIVTFVSDDSQYRYTEVDLIQFFDDKEIDSLILINPDNPSGNYLTNTGVRSLLSWARERNISIVVDESFSDFVSIESYNSLFDNQLLDDYQNLFVIKSISKSYGVPGIRLGVLASSDVKTVEEIRKTLPIWNINSVAEFFMQIYVKYEKDYINSLLLITDARKKMYEKLRHIKYLNCFPSEANYIMCEIKGCRAIDLAAFLIEKNVLIKDLTEKIKDGKQYIRLAVRNEEENDVLISLLAEYEQ